MTLSAAEESGPDRLDIGRPATADEIGRWDIDVSPTGAGLPSGGATAREGEPVYQAKCAACHGETGREKPHDRLAGREPGDEFSFGDNLTMRRTVGNYWPYATTLFDYTRRAMPAGAPGSLTDNEVYAVTAYVLYLNDLVGLDEPINALTLPVVAMPARDRFLPDDRRGGAEVR
jgi:cytochrome c